MVIDNYFLASEVLFGWLKMFFFFPKIFNHVKELYSPKCQVCSLKRGVKKDLRINSASSSTNPL
jgi:hypothetical protein